MKLIPTEMKIFYFGTLQLAAHCTQVLGTYKIFLVYILDLDFCREVWTLCDSLRHLWLIPPHQTYINAMYTTYLMYVGIQFCQVLVRTYCIPLPLSIPFPPPTLPHPHHFPQQYELCLVIFCFVLNILIGNAYEVKAEPFSHIMDIP